MYILSADFGTSSVKVAIVDENINIVQSSKREYDYKVFDTDKVEIEVKDVENAFIEAVIELKEYLPNVAAISFDTFAPSYIMMDKAGNALYPIVAHLDRRSRAYSKKIINTVGKDKYRDITGTLPHAGGVTLTTILWFMEHEKELFDKTYKIGHLTTYLYKKLTGIWAIDQVNASITGMYETIKDNGWSSEICESFNIPMDKLPPVKDAGSVYSGLVEEMATKIGVATGTPVILGTQDVASAQIGANAVESGDVLCISGSSEMLSILTDKPITNDKYYVRTSATKGIWQVFLITIGGFALEWFRKEFYREMNEDEFFNIYLSDLLNNRFSMKSVRFLPYLAGDRQSLIKKKGSFNGLTLESTRDNMLCALLSGIQEPSKNLIDLCSDIINPNTSIKATGNMVENEAYLKIKKQIFNVQDIEVIDNCPIKGNVIMTKNILEADNKYETFERAE